MIEWKALVGETRGNTVVVATLDTGRKRDVLVSLYSALGKRKGGIKVAIYKDRIHHTYYATLPIHRY